MPNPNQRDLVDGMIARIEEANAKAYEQFASASERTLKSEQESTPQPPDQPDLPAAPNRQSSRARPLFFALIGLLLAASTCVTAFAWDPSYGDAAKLAIARWANALVLQTVPLAQTTPRDSVPAAPSVSPEIAQRLQRAADDLANVEQQIEQLKASQEQMVRDNAKVFDQLNASLAQMTRQNAAVAKQLKATQEQLADVASANPARRRRP
jgi:uncharacterized protein YgiM (DUF1202 family)